MATFFGEVKSNLRRKISDKLEDVQHKFSAAGIREKIEESTGVVGQALRSRREREEKQANIQKQLSKISETTERIRSSHSSLTSIELSFIQIAKNFENINASFGVSITLQDETNKSLATEITAPQTGPQAVTAKPAAEKINKEDDDTPSILDNIFDLMDLLDKKKKAVKKKHEKFKRQIKKGIEKIKQQPLKPDQLKKIEESATKAKQVAEAEAKAAGKGAKEVSKAGQKAAKQAFKKLSQDQIRKAARNTVIKALAKAGLKAIPFFGVAAGAAFAVHALLQGKYTEAGLEAAGGLAGPISSIPLAIESAIIATYWELYGVDFATDYANDPEGAKERHAECARVVEEEFKKALTDRVKPETRPDQKKTKGQQVRVSKEEAKDLLSRKDLTDKDLEGFGGRAALEQIAGPMLVIPPPAVTPVLTSPIPPPPAATPVQTGTGLKLGGGVGLKAPEPPPGGGDKWVMDMIVQHEGFKTKPYKDSLGLWTIGVGHLIGDGKTLPPEWNREFTKEEVMTLFDKDYEHHKKLAEKLPGYSLANEKGRAALIDLTFNMGPGWASTFKLGVQALLKGDFKEAANQFIDSKWFKQVKGRGVTITNLLRDGGKGGATSVAGSPSTGVQVGQQSTDVAAAKPTQQNNVTVVAINQTNTTRKTVSAPGAPQTIGAVG
jgi:lysozyme